MLTGSAAIAAQGNDQPRGKSRVRVAKPTAMTSSTRVGGNTSTVRTRERFVSRGNSATIGTRNRVVTRSGYPYRTYGYRSYSYGYPYYSYGYGYPYYGYYPYSGFSFGYYPYDYSYPYDSGYGYYSSRPAYGAYANSSVVVQVQTRLARAGYYHGVIDGVMGPRTRYAIQAYERDHGLRVDGVIGGQLLRSMGLRY